jgi:hypothetical protein
MDLAYRVLSLCLLASLFLVVPGCNRYAPPPSGTRNCKIEAKAAAN